MLRLNGLWKLTWIELKVFLREPLGAIGTIVIPVLVYLGVGRAVGRRLSPNSLVNSSFMRSGLPVLASIVIAFSAALSLITIISIYREGGILKRLRATPLRPQTILTAHVIVKLMLTAATLVLMVLSGKRYYPVDVHVPLVSFTIALLVSTLSIVAIGFLIASIVPTARFAQPIGAIILYPMLVFSGLFIHISDLPPVLRLLAQVLPMTYAVRLLEGIWNGDRWLAHLGDVAALTGFFLLLTPISSRVFRWE